MAIPWNLERELCGLVNATSVREAIWRLGVISEPSPEAVIEEVHDWTRGGAETFIYRFRVLLPGTVHDVLLKAIVAFSTAKSLSEIGDEWVTRRQLLEHEGIRTPTLYYAGRALLVEQFIPQKLSEFLRRGPIETTPLFDQVIQFAATLEKLGFRPISLFHDLRTDGVDVFVVDFGEDLGPPALTLRRDGRLLREAIRWLKNNTASSQVIDEDRATALYALHAADRSREGTDGLSVEDSARRMRPYRD